MVTERGVCFLAFMVLGTIIAVSLFQEWVGSEYKTCHVPPLRSWKKMYLLLSKAETAASDKSSSMPCVRLVLGLTTVHHQFYSNIASLHTWTVVMQEKLILE